MGSGLTHFDLTSCQLSSISAQTIRDLIQSQSFKRQAEAWKDSLRYGRPDLDNMRGLRRITLNHNPLIRDAGAIELAKALEADLWLKALDMQQCGLTNEGARVFIDKLKGTNTSLYVLDLRLNEGVDKQMVKSVMELVMTNGDSTGLNEYEWMDIGGRGKLGPTKHAITLRQNSRSKAEKFGKQQSSVESKLKRSKSASSIRSSLQSHERGIPWRTAARAEKAYRAALTSRRDNAKREESIEQFIDNITSSSEYMRPSTAITMSRPRKSEFFETRNDKTNCSVRELLIILRKEQETKTKLEDMLLKLQDENVYLKSEINMLRSATKHQHRRSIIDDENALDVIELTLNKYRQFLDFLRMSGYGNLIEIGEENFSAKRSHAKAVSKSHHKPKSSHVDAFSRTKKSTTPRPEINTDELVEFNIRNRGFVPTNSNSDNAQNYNIDNLLTNALEISRSYRNINTTSRQNNSPRKETSPSQESNQHLLQVVTSPSGRQQQYSATTPASSSPATTVIVNEKSGATAGAATAAQPPPITSRSSSKKSEAPVDVVEDISQILTDEDEEKDKNEKKDEKEEKTTTITNSKF